MTAETRIWLYLGAGIVGVVLLFVGDGWQAGLAAFGVFYFGASAGLLLERTYGAKRKRGES